MLFHDQEYMGGQVGRAISPNISMYDHLSRLLALPSGGTLQPILLDVAVIEWILTIFR